MQYGQWPWSLCIAVLPLLVYIKSTEGVFGLVLACQVLGFVNYSYTEPQERFSRWTAFFDIIPRGLLFIVTARTSVQLQHVSSPDIYCLCAATAVHMANALYALTHLHSSTVFRAYAYVVGMAISSVLAVLHVQQLHYFTYDNDGPRYSLFNTTALPCTQDTSGTAGFVYNTRGYSNACPTKLWEDIRLNVIFATQLYVLFTLTTGLQRDETLKDTYLPGILAIAECAALSIAATVQFDVIKDCYQVSLTVAVTALVSQLLYLFRLFLHYVAEGKKRQVAERKATRWFIHNSPCTPCTEATRPSPKRDLFEGLVHHSMGLRFRKLTQKTPFDHKLKF